MKYLIAVIAVSALALAGIEPGIAVGFAVADNPQPVPMLSLGYATGGFYSLAVHGAVIGFADKWEPLGFVSGGFGPVRLGVCRTTDQWGSYVGFEAPLTGNARIVSRVLNIEGEPVYSVTGLSISL